MSDRFFLNHRDPARRRRRDHTPLARLMQPSERTITSRQLRQDIVSLAGLIGRPVLNQAGDEVGRVADLLAKVHGGETYPLVTGLVMRVGRRRAFLDASAIDRLHRRSVTLRTARLDLREFQRRDGEVELARDILDHQLVDTDEIQVIRAADGPEAACRRSRAIPPSVPDPRPRGRSGC